MATTWDQDQSQDRGNPLLDIAASLRVCIGNLNDTASSIRESLNKQATMAMAPVRSREIKAVTGPASGIICADICRPPQGMYYYIRSIVVGGLTPITAAAGSVYVFVSAMAATQVTNFNQLGTGEWRDYSAALPNVAFYGRGELPLQFGERLIVAVSGATAGQQYVINAQFEAYQEAADRQVVGV